MNTKTKFDADKDCQNWWENHTKTKTKNSAHSTELKKKENEKRYLSKQTITDNSMCGAHAMHMRNQVQK